MEYHQDQCREMATKVLWLRSGKVFQILLYIKNLIGSMRKRCEAVIERGGERISY